MLQAQRVVRLELQTPPRWCSGGTDLPGRLATLCCHYSQSCVGRKTVLTPVLLSTKIKENINHYVIQC